MPDPNKLALVIGIDVYDDKNLDQLPSCKKDARGILNLLSAIDYTISGQRPIIGSDLDKENGWGKIRVDIGNFFTKAKPSQTLLFYFSGHGILRGNELYLATPQIDSKDPATKGYSISELINYVGDCKSRRIVCIIDSCYSGTADLTMKSKAAKDEADDAKHLFDTSWKRIPKSKGSYLLLSSQSYEKSWAEDDNSLFTKYVIEGLKGVKPITDKNGRYIEGSGSVDSNGDVTPDSLHEYVYDKVNSRTNQTPVLKMVRVSKIVLAEHPDLAKIPQTSHKDYLLQKDYLLHLLREGKIKEFNENRKKDNYSRMEFSHEVLSHRDLSRADFRGVDLKSAYLNGTKLQHVLFVQASLSGTHFEFSDLSNADLSRARLSYALLAGADLSNANLSNANLVRANLEKAKLSGADLKGANLAGAELSSLNLSSLNLSNADLSYADLSYADLSYADLSNANLSFAELSYANLSKANLASSIIVGLRYIQRKKGYPLFKNAKFDNAIIIDHKKLCRHFHNNKAKNIPPPVKNKKELREKLEQRGFNRETIERYLALSSLPNTSR